MKELVLLVSDNTMMLEGLKLVINSQPDMIVTGKVSNNEPTPNSAEQVSPNIIVKDISDRLLREIYSIKILKQVYKDTKILILAVSQDTSYLSHLRQAGISGYMLKSATSNELLRAIRTIATGGFYIDPTVAGKFIDHHFKQSTRLTASQTIGLSGREEEVLRSFAFGYSNKEIAFKLTISIKTVETYLARIKEKLNLKDRVGITYYALSQGWLTL